jgi:Zn-dependent protease with chaperone function
MRFPMSLIVLALLAPGVDAIAQTEVNRGGRNLFSKEQDVEIGRQAAAEAEKQYPVLSDQQVQRYVQDLGARLAAQAPGPKFPYTFKVVDVADINAFALPGGPVYINRGTIEQARTEGELAGVIAHEISHVDLRHGTRQATKAYGSQMVLGLLGSLIGSGDTTRQVIDAIGGFSLNSVLLRYSRDAETDADILGSQMLARAGYDPREMATFFELLAAQSPRRTKEFFSSHPAPERRRARIEQEAGLLGAGQRTVNQDRFRSIQARLKAMPPALTMEQLASGQRPPTSGGGSTGSTLPTAPGRVEAPSRNLEWYDSPSKLYRVAHPDNWQVVSETQTNVTIAAPGGAFRTSRGVEITHGVLLGIHAVKGTTSSPRYGWDDDRLESATDELVSSLLKGSPYLRPVSSSRKSVTIDNGPGVVLTLTGSPDSYSDRERVDVVTALVDDARLAYMLFVTPDGASRDYAQLRDAMIRNLRVANR